MANQDRPKNPHSKHHLEHGRLQLRPLNGQERSLESLYFFFFSSRRRHTILQGDWSSDVCSSDLSPRVGEPQRDNDRDQIHADRDDVAHHVPGIAPPPAAEPPLPARGRRDIRSTLDRKSVV